MGGVEDPSDVDNAVNQGPAIPREDRVWKTQGLAALGASIERGMPWLLSAWAVGLLAFLVLATEPLGLDEGASSAAPLVFFLAVATAFLLLVALALAVRQVMRVDGGLRFAWAAAALVLLMASLPALANLMVNTRDYEDEKCGRWAILPAGSFDALHWMPGPAWAAVGAALGICSLVFLVFRPTRRPGAWLLGGFLLWFLLSLGALDGCPDV